MLDYTSPQNGPIFSSGLWLPAAFIWRTETYCTWTPLPVKKTSLGYFTQQRSSVLRCELSFLPFSSSLNRKWLTSQLHSCWCKSQTRNNVKPSPAPCELIVYLWGWGESASSEKKKKNWWPFCESPDVNHLRNMVWMSWVVCELMKTEGIVWRHLVDTQRKTSLCACREEVSKQTSLKRKSCGETNHAMESPQYDRHV